MKKLVLATTLFASVMSAQAAIFTEHTNENPAGWDTTERDYAIFCRQGRDACDALIRIDEYFGESIRTRAQLNYYSAICFENASRMDKEGKRACKDIGNLLKYIGERVVYDAQIDTSN